MSTPDERRAIKARAPVTRLLDLHTHDCRVVPDREALLERLPRGGIAAEIGVAFGEFTRQILRRNKPDRLHLVDMWDSPRYAEGLKKIQADFAGQFEAGQLVVNRGRSVDVLPLFPDASFDWVYIDTDHSYHTTAQELRICHAKVKKDGLILGHDYCNGNVISPWPYGVIEACHEFCVDYGWKYVYLTLESHGHLSFALARQS